MHWNSKTTIHKAPVPEHNNTEMDDMKAQINEDLDFSEDWTIYNKIPWEGYGSKKEHGSKRL